MPQGSQLCSQLAASELDQARAERTRAGRIARGGGYVARRLGTDSEIKPSSG
jgi:hypothetical protein